MATTKTEEKKAASTEVAVKTPTPLAVMPDFMDAGDAGQGFEGAGKESYAIPFIQILQKMSPMVDEDDPKHIPGAKAGMLFNTVTQKLIDGKTGMLVIPCSYKRSYIQWGGREGEGGFKGEMTPEAFDKLVADGKVEVVEGRPLLKDEKGEVHPKKSDYFADTRSHFVVFIDPDTGEYSQAILALSSTQIKASRMLMTSLQQKKIDVGGVKKTPPTFANMVRLTTVGQANDKGSWSGAKFDLEALVSDPELYAAAKDFYKAIVAGDVNVDHSKNATTSNEEVSGEASKADEF